MSKSTAKKKAPRALRSDLGEVKTQFFTFGSRQEPFQFRTGEKLDSITLAYETYGELSPAHDNAILVFHALSGSQHAAGLIEGREAAHAQGCAEVG